MAPCESAVLVVALLSIESSYLSEIERPRADVPDTVQFWLQPGGVHWRIKTFAIDHDIHVYRIGDATHPSGLSPERAEENIRKSYGDVIERLEVLCIPRGESPDNARGIIQDAALPGELEVAEAGFAFLNPDRGTYRSQSKPK